MSFAIKNNVALAPLTTLKVGGAARFFVEAKSEEEISRAVAYARENDLPLFILGGGSNVLISDEGFTGLVLKISLLGITALQGKNEAMVTAQAGEDWDQFVNYCVENDLQGVECLSGIPGTVGGTPVQNVGAYGQEVSETIAAVRVLEIETGRIFEMNSAECGFAYRTSIFNTTHKDRFIVLAVGFRLKPGGEPKIVYRDLQQLFGEKRPDLRQTRGAVRQIRAAKSMVIDESDPNSKSAGSFFKNPVVGRGQFDEIQARARRQGIEAVPKFDIDEETFKVPAAWLIENSGFHKGFRFGRVGLSTRHTLAIVNSGAGTARDIVALKNEIQTRVKEKFGVWLKPEPVFVGFEETSGA